MAIETNLDFLLPKPLTAPTVSTVVKVASVWLENGQAITLMAHRGKTIHEVVFRVDYDGAVRLFSDLVAEPFEVLEDCARKQGDDDG